MHRVLLIENMFSMFSVICAFLPLVTSEIVSTEYGDIEGLVTSYPNASGPFKSISKFLGIPFAAPPIGELRLKAPEPPKKWKPNVLQTKKHGNVCWQGDMLEFNTRIFAPNFTYSEDCLYLDVYSPNVSQSLPVLFYIHGGGYEYGTALTYPSDLLALHGIVVVVIQYRLGPFGFLTTGDSAAPGNFGMLDQVEALKWVKENIEHFGGDPSKVTICGLSAGAASVSLHLPSPLSKGLFHQAIAESGVDLSPFAIQPISSALRFATDLSQKLDCGTKDHSTMLSCILQQKDADIQKASDSIPFGISDNVRWGPVVDNYFLLDTPRNLRKKGDFRKVKWMISFTSQEGAGSLGVMANWSFGIAESVDNGVSPSFFQKFLTNFAHSRNSR